MSACWCCGKRVTPTRVRPNPTVLGTNTKIRFGKKRMAAMDLPPGPGGFGACPTITPACDGCYAQQGAVVFGSAEERRIQTMALFGRDRQAWIEKVVAEIKAEERKEKKARRATKKRPMILRIHGFGDFFSTEYLTAWIEIVGRCPSVQFFGTTRTWIFQFQARQFISPATKKAVKTSDADRQKYLDALAIFVHRPNVFFGASMEGDVYLASSERIKAGDPSGGREKGTGMRVGLTAKHINHRSFVFSRGPHKGRKIVDVLRDQGFTIWNMLSEVADPALRKRFGLNVKTGAVHDRPNLDTGKRPSKASVARARAAVDKQFSVGKREGWLTGTYGCPEQRGRLKDCDVCRHCLHRTDGTTRWDVNFAFHPGKSRKAQEVEELVRESWGLPRQKSALDKWRRQRGYTGAGWQDRLAGDLLKAGAKPINVEA